MTKMSQNPVDSKRGKMNLAVHTGSCVDEEFKDTRAIMSKTKGALSQSQSKPVSQLRGATTPTLAQFN